MPYRTCLFVLFCAINAAGLFAKDVLYLGKITAKSATVPTFSILVNGTLVKVDQDFFSFQGKPTDTATILFTNPENLFFTTKKNTVLSVELRGGDFKLYELTQTTNEQQRQTWIITEEHPERVIINEHTLVIPINPQKVSLSVQNVDWRKVPNLVKLPTITIHTKSATALQQAICEGIITSLSVSPFYSDQKIESAFTPNTKISMILP